MSIKRDTDVAVIGAGIGGYVAAIRLGQLGRRVVLIEREKVGGVCLNIGCIPSKALITASKFVKTAKNASKMGIDAEVSIDFNRLQDWKKGVVERLTNGVSLLCKTNKVEIIKGEARILGANELEIRSSDNSSQLSFNSLIVATGSSPVELQSARYDGKRIISSTEALELAYPPKSMLIIGGGVIGLEIGMAYANLFGTQLIIVELLDQLLPGVDRELVNVVSRNLQRMGGKVYLKSKVKSALASADSVDVIFEPFEVKEEKIKVEYVLVSVGRKPNSAALGLEKVGVETDGKGYIKVDRQMRTTSSNIYAVGDVVGLPLLAHKASRQGIVAAEAIHGLKTSYDNIAMPSAIFTDPEIAVVGTSPEEAEKLGNDIVIGRFPMIANGRALASLESDGFVKVIAERKSGLILGVEIVGMESSDLISEATLAIEMGATLDDLSLTIHPHPTLTEAIMEAAENAMGKAIHIQNRPR